MKLKNSKNAMQNRGDILIVKACWRTPNLSQIYLSMQF